MDFTLHLETEAVTEVYIIMVVGGKGEGNGDNLASGTVAGTLHLATVAVTELDDDGEERGGNDGIHDQKNEEADTAFCN